MIRPAKRDCAVGAVERSQRGDRAAALGQLENRAVAGGASVIGCAVEIAAAVHDQPGIRVFAVGAVERSQRGDRAAALGQLENRAVAVGAARPTRRAVEIAAAVHDQAGQSGSAPLVPLNEASVVIVPLPLAISKTVPSPLAPPPRLCHRDCRCRP